MLNSFGKLELRSNYSNGQETEQGENIHDKDRYKDSNDDHKEGLIISKQFNEVPYLKRNHHGSADKIDDTNNE